METLEELKKYTSMNEIVKTIFADSSLTLSNKEAIIMREILDVIVSIEFSTALYYEVVMRILQDNEHIYNHIFKNKRDVDKVIASLCKKGFITKKTVKGTKGQRSSYAIILVNKKISKSEMDGVISSLAYHGFPAVDCSVEQSVN